jgi:plastocyanin
MRRCGLILAAAGLAAILGAAAYAQPQQVRVYIYDFAFSINPPGEPVVPAVCHVGDRVIWTPVDDFHDTVACVGQAEYWESPIMRSFEAFDWTFTIPGVYTYYCSPHGSDNGDGTASGMQSTITVLPVPAPGAAGLAATALAMGLRRPRRR